MPILNYTTSISAEKTVGEIQRSLAKAKASQILTEYDADATVVALSFRIPSRFGLMTFRLPANVDAIHKILQRQRCGKRDRPQAARVAWRIVKDWVEAQLAIVEAGMVDVEQVFLPYLQNESGVTVYEDLKERKFERLALQ